jgi:hypothetical protein
VPGLVRHEIDGVDLDAIAVYAALRALVPARASILIEAPAEGWSLVGVAARRGETLGPGVDAAGAQDDELARGDAPPDLAHALARARVGWLAESAAHAHHGLRIADAAPSAQLYFELTFTRIEHGARRATVIAPPGSERGAERCVQALGGVAAAAPRPWKEEATAPRDLVMAPAADVLAARVRRAQAFLSDDVRELVLGASFVAPLGAGTALDAYRALRAREPAAFGIFLDEGASPLAAGSELATIAGAPLFARAHGDTEPSLRDALHAALPSADATGGPDRLAAARLLARLEDGSRGVWGGALGLLCPGGAACLLSAHPLLTASGGHLGLALGVRVREGCEAATAIAEARAGAEAHLAAMAAAQR